MPDGDTCQKGGSAESTVRRDFMEMERAHLNGGFARAYRNNYIHSYVNSDQVVAVRGMIASLFSSRSMGDLAFTDTTAAAKPPTITAAPTPSPSCSVRSPAGAGPSP